MHYSDTVLRYTTVLVIADSMALRFTKVLVGYIKTYDEVVENNIMLKI